MKNFEDIYQEMFNTIYSKGKWTSDNVRTKYADGTPAKRKQYLGYTFRFDNSTDIAPILNSRFTPVKDTITELYWIWILQSNDVNVLKELKCNFWNEWMLNDGTIGKSYGYQIGKETMGFKSQLHYIVNEIKNNPDSTRIKTTLYNIDDLPFMSLFPCVYGTTWHVLDGVLYLSIQIRSSDFALGLPANVYQYSVLHRLVANECGLPCGDIIFNIENLHYYDRHEEILLHQFEYYNKNIRYTDLDKNSSIVIDFHNTIFDFKPEMVKLTTNNKLLPKYKYEIAI